MRFFGRVIALREGKSFMRKYILIFLYILFSPPTYAFDPYSNTELDTIKKEYLEEINRPQKVIGNLMEEKKINAIEKKLAQAGEVPFASFFIVNSDEMNAFAGPGGYIGIHSSLIAATDNEDELAAVMAHELAHVKLHHLYDMIEHEKLMKIPTAASMLAAIALGMLNPALGTGAMAATLAGGAQQSINYTRYHERQADRIGMQMLQKAGYNPIAMANFFQKLQNQSRYYARDNIPAILLTHPLDQERIAEVENRLPKKPNPVFNNNLDFQLFKTIIRVASTKDPKVLLDYYTNAKDTPANRYGLALTLLDTNRFTEAYNKLLPLVDQNPNHPFITISLADAEIGKHDNTEAINTLIKLHQAYPEMQAVMLALAQAYLATNQADKGAMLLTKAFSQEPHNLTICKSLAKAEAQNKREAYAYFTEGQCDHLQGHDNVAILRLKTALKLVKNDNYLKARIEAKLEEIRFLAQFSQRKKS